MDFQDIRFPLANYSWMYRGEGNANIVISLPKEGKVLRLRKSNGKQLTKDVAVLQQLQLEMKFVDVVMRAILGNAFVKLSCLVHLSQEDVQMLNCDLLSLRPELRHGKYLSCTCAQLCEDFTLFPSATSFNSPSFCVELKPKQGGFPPSHPKTGKCTFCLKQQLKLNEGLASKRSEYCPLDLFSGLQPRMVRAVKSLLHTPQNNLRIFCDGKLIYGDGNSQEELHVCLSNWLAPLPGSDKEEQFALLLVQALSKSFARNDDSPERTGLLWTWDGLPCHEIELRTVDNSANRNEDSCDWNISNLPDGCILHCLALAQAMDLHGLDYVSEIASTSSKYNPGEESGTFDNLHYVYEVLDKGCSSKLDPVEAYLIASTVRDCSILLTFQKLLGDISEDLKETSVSTVEDELSKEKYRFKVAIVDIDPKPFSCIKNHILKRNACHESNKTKE